MRRLALFVTFMCLLSACGAKTADSAQQSSAIGHSEAAKQSTTSTTAGHASMLGCPKYGASRNVGTITEPELDELSGLAASQKNPGLFWTHNDSGDSARAFAINLKGELQGTYNLPDAVAVDIEDIAVSNGEVWLSDTGDNLHFRSHVELYHFPEPNVADGGTPPFNVQMKTLKVKFEKPDGTGMYPINAESFFIDKVGNGYLVEKTQDQTQAWVFQIAAADMNGESATARPIVQITGNASGQGVGPTAADLSADNTTLVIKNYVQTYEWHFTADSSIPEVLKQHPLAPCTVRSGLGEAITFNGKGLLTVEEGVGKPLVSTPAG